VKASHLDASPSSPGYAGAGYDVSFK